MADPMSSPEYRLAFGSALDALLRQKAVSNTELSEGVGLQNRTVEGWLAGAHLPEPDVLSRIAEALALSADEQADLQTAHAVAWLGRHDPANAHRLATAPRDQIRQATAALNTSNSDKRRRDIV